MPQGERIPMEGVLNCWNDDHDLPDLLLAVSRSGKTGRLHFSNPEGDKTLDLDAGKIVFAESSSQDDGLGQYLLRTGKISLMDYTRVSRMVQPGKRLGALLVAEGVLDESELVPAVVGQVRAVILGLFRRTETWYRFKEMKLEPTESITLDLSVPDLILEGVRYVESWRRVSKGVGSLESLYTQISERENEWVSANLDDGALELVDMLAEPTSLAEICDRATLPDFEACRYLWAFRALGWIDIADAVEKVSVTEAASALEAAGLSPADVVTQPSVAVKPPPAPPRPTPEELAQTQLAIEPPVVPDPPEVHERADDRAKSPTPAPPPIPERLVATRVSIPREDLPTEPDGSASATATAEKKAPAPPKPVPEDLVQTRLSIDPPPAVPSKTAAPTRAIPDELMHTQMFIEPPMPPAPSKTPASPEPPGLVEPPSTGEFMESILEGDAPKSPVRPPAEPEPSHAATQFFAGPSALDPNPFEDSADAFDAPSLSEPSEPEAPPNPEPATQHATPAPPRPEPPKAPEMKPAKPLEPAAAPSGFEALALGDALGSPIGPPSRPAPSSKSPMSTPMTAADTPTMPSFDPPPMDGEMASFRDVSLPDDAFSNAPLEVLDTPAPDPFVPQAPPPEPAPLPMVEADVIAREPASDPHETPLGPPRFDDDGPLIPRPPGGPPITQESLVPPRRVLRNNED